MRRRDIPFHLAILGLAALVLAMVPAGAGASPLGGDQEVRAEAALPLGSAGQSGLSIPSEEEAVFTIQQWWYGGYYGYPCYGCWRYPWYGGYYGYPYYGGWGYPFLAYY